VNVVQMPPGWVLNYPSQVLDGIRLPAPTPDTPRLHFYAAIPQAALNAGNPIGQFRIVSNHPPGTGLAHALIQGQGTQTWTLFPVPVPEGGGPPIPTVSEWGLIVTAILILCGGTILLRRRSRAPAVAA
jgi:hypothetical protein